jgi:uncharacterized protein YbjT (DUF2867 family)
MNKGNDLILVFGATGQQGGAVANELLAAGHRLRVATRHPEGAAAKALAARGAEVVRGDLDDPASLPKIFADVWGVFAVQNTWEAGVEQEEVQGKRVAEMAKAAGVRHFVYSSVGSAHRKTGIPHFDNKARVEATVRALGFPSFTILRPVFFMENWTSPWFKPYIDQGNLAVGIKPDTKLQMIAVADIGKYGRLAFEKHAELNVLSEAAGKSISHFQVPIEEVRKASDDFATMLEWFDAVGYDADITGNATKFGIQPTRLAEWAKTVAW